MGISSHVSGSFFFAIFFFVVSSVQKTGLQNDWISFFSDSRGVRGGQIYVPIIFEPHGIFKNYYNYCTREARVL